MKTTMKAKKRVEQLGQQLIAGTFAPRWGVSSLAGDLRWPETPRLRPPACKNSWKQSVTHTHPLALSPAKSQEFQQILIAFVLKEAQKPKPSMFMHQYLHKSRILILVNKLRGSLGRRCPRSPRFPNKAPMPNIPKQGFQTRRCPRLPRFQRGKVPKQEGVHGSQSYQTSSTKSRFPSPAKIPRFGFQSRFPNKKLSKVSKQGSQALGRFPGLGSQTSPQTRGFPSKVSQGSQARLLRSSTLAVEVCRGRENVKCTLFT